MISFVTLLLGIVVGARPIEVQAASGVATVEFRLDGQLLVVLPAPPWKTKVDFGAPAPHELVAIARDAAGAEIGRAVQRINVPRSLAEATLTLLPGTGGRGRTARLAWASAQSEKPERTELTMDGQPLEPGDFKRIALPDFRPADVHVLRAVLDFKGGEKATTELLVGGVKRATPNGPEVMRGETQAELTAVPVIFKGRPPKESRMDGWFLADGQPVRVEAVEESSGDIVVVMDEKAGPWLSEFGEPSLDPAGWYESSLRKGQRLSFCWPGTLQPGDAAPGYDVFLRSREYVALQDGPRVRLDVRGLLIRVQPPELHGPARLADAVGVAALMAARGNRPRAVLLLVAGPDDESAMPAGWVREYLLALRVPLHVWAKNKKVAGGWGKVEVLKDVDDLVAATSRLTGAVERQRIVWLEGLHLPQAISLSPKARSVTLVR
ncbi:MAG: hypothetical protein PT977_09850 [Acidobacteriota bacterium]|nr:hypothetical protein [Acidobacteriota bacterium]